jgi:YidC/Oxa1 family membrane protein insertase
MEQKRLLIAIVLSFAVFFLWSMFFAPKTPKKEDVTIQQSTAESTTAETVAPKTVDAPVAVEGHPAPVQPSTTETSGIPARSITVSSPLYTMTLSENNAAIVSMILKGYRETIDKDSPYKELIPKDLKEGTMEVYYSGNGAKQEGIGLYKADYPSDHLEVDQQPVDIRFLYQDDNGLQIAKTYRFRPDSYLIGLSVSVFNAGHTVIDGKLGISMETIMDKKAGGYAFEGPCGLINNSLEQVKIKKIKDNGVLEGNIRWAAIESRYFMTSIIPRESIKGQLLLSYNEENGRVINELRLDNSSLAPQQSEKQEFDIFMGPKSVSLLRSFHNELDKAINFGWVDILAKPCLWFMNFIYGFIPNYGVAIIILTIVTRLIFWPLATKSYKSMGEMRKLQPLMQEIREKYKNDKQRMNQEVMGLYRTYKINPMGGCLPMIIQLPVFFALYRMLYQAIELRHAPFVWWINDLSAPDRLFNFSFKIPFMEAPYGIPVLTLIMAATMLIQQKMTPTPGDPSQAKMMMFMPLIFLFIFINFSSGLVLYWLVSNIVSISQQYYIQKKVA